MDVLWGAWVKQVNFGRESIDISGIYQVIWKEKKGDFPFIIDLHVILAYEALQAECDKKLNTTVEIIDQDAINRIFQRNFYITVPQGDMPLRWYEDYVFENVEIREPGYYELIIFIENQCKQRVPLRVVAPKMMIIDEKNDIKTELWPEDLERWEKEN